MSAPLKPPPSDLHDISLETVEVQVESLYRISKHASGEPYFGRSAGNRFDDNSRPPSKRYGTCYLGLTLQVAIAETVLHGLMPMGGTSWCLPTNSNRSRSFASGLEPQTCETHWHRAQKDRWFK